MAVCRLVVVGSACIGSVYTLFVERGYGYGLVVIVVVMRHVFDEGAILVLFIDLVNLVFNAIYQRLGYYFVDDFIAFRYG